MVGRSSSIIPSIPADNQYHVWVTQSRQLIGLLNQARFPSGELLRFCFRCIWHVVRVLLQLDGGEVKKVDC